MATPSSGPPSTLTGAEAATHGQRAMAAAANQGFLMMSSRPPRSGADRSGCAARLGVSAYFRARMMTALAGSVTSSMSPLTVAPPKAAGCTAFGASKVL